MDNLILVNDSKYDGNKRWSWNIWLDGPSSELEKVRSVKYFLHPTFKDPIVLISNKSSNFMLSGSGWGEFNIKAEVKLNSGINLEMNHWLTFDAIEKKSIRDKTIGHIYIYHSSIDGPLASIIASMLISKDYMVTAAAIYAPIDIEEDITNILNKTDLSLILISPGMSEYIETYLAHKMEFEEKHKNKLLFALLGNVDIELNSSIFKTIKINSKNELEKIIEAVVTLIST
ncbi:MAG: pYEATS domain-containing protein [Saprospiraceae bacterium]